MSSGAQSAEAATSAREAATAARRVDLGTPTAAAPATVVGNRIVVAYVAIAVAMLVPGLLLKIGALPALPGIGPWSGWLREVLHGIRFGSGLRFWLGVAGAALMAPMLLYPVRKMLGRGRGLGRVSAWFHWHIVLGLAAPVLALYHCNFGLGGSNANLTLWTTLAVTTSGIVGFFFHRPASAAFYGDRHATDQRLGRLIELLMRFDVLHRERQHLIDAMAGLAHEQTAPQKGILPSLRSRWRLERQCRALWTALDRHIALAAHQLCLTADEHRRARAMAGREFPAFARAVRRASGRSLREQIWALWRKFHLPVFLILPVTLFLHVASVWDLDWPTPSRDAPAPASQWADLPAPPLPPPRPAPKAFAAKSPAARAKPPAGGIAGRKTVFAAQSEAGPPEQRIDPASSAAPARLAAPALLPQRATSDADTPARIPVPKAVPRTAQDRSGPRMRGPSPPAATPPPPAPPMVAFASPAPAIPAPSHPATAELARRMDMPPPMGLGGTRPRTLDEQIAAFKTQRAAGQFLHTTAETGFALVGKHLSVECSDCHKKPLREARQEAQRACIDCHKTDDAHNGRRPDCAQCHVPRRWSEIVRRR